MNTPSLTDAAVEQIAQKCFATYLSEQPNTPFNDAVVSVWLASEGMSADAEMVRAVRHRVASSWSNEQVLQQMTMVWGRPLFHNQVTVDHVKTFLQDNGLVATVKKTVRDWFLVIDRRRETDWLALVSHIAESLHSSQRDLSGNFDHAVFKELLAARNLSFTLSQLRALSFAVRDCLSAKVVVMSKPEKSHKAGSKPSNQVQRYARIIRSSFSSEVSLQEVKSALLKYGENSSDFIVDRIHRMAKELFEVDAVKCTQALKKRQVGKLLLDEVRDHFVSAGFHCDDPVIVRTFKKLKRLSNHTKKERGVLYTLYVASSVDREGFEILKGATKLNPSDAVSLLLRTIGYLAALSSFNLDAVFRHAYAADDDTVRLWLRSLAPFDLSDYREIARLRQLEYVERRLAKSPEIALRPNPDLEILQALQDQYGKNPSVTICLSLRVMFIAANAPGINIVDLFTRSAGLSDKASAACILALRNQLQQAPEQPLQKPRKSKRKGTVTQ